MHWIFRKDGRDEGLSQSERWCVHFLSCGNDLALTNNDDNNHNTHTTVKSVTHSELFLLYFHLDSHRFLVNFTSKTSAYLNPAKKNKEKKCLLWAEEKRNKVFVVLLPLQPTREGLGMMVVTESKQGNSRERWALREKCICTGLPQAHPRSHFLLQRKEI